MDKQNPFIFDNPSGKWQKRSVPLEICTDAAGNIKLVRYQDCFADEPAEIIDISLEEVFALLKWAQNRLHDV